MSLSTYALVLDTVVDNIVVVDAATVGGQEYLKQMEVRYGVADDVTDVSPVPQIGWIYRSPGVYVLPEVLVSSTMSLAANGSNSALITYTNNTPHPPSQITFNINEITTNEVVVSGVAQIEVSASAVGPVHVRCGDLTLTLEAS